MKKIILCVLATVLLAAPCAFAAQGFPTSLAGFTLGADVEEYDDFCELDKAVPVSDAPFLSEALIEPDALPGVRGGSLSFGNCGDKDKLVRIKLKFHDKNQKFFDKLHKKYEKAFGKPDRYLGDAFKNVIAWEWQFKNDKGEQIFLILMWSRDKEIRPGVSIKMTHQSLMDAEYQCYREEHLENGGKGQRTRVRSLDKYVPR